MSRVLNQTVTHGPASSLHGAAQRKQRRREQDDAVEEAISRRIEEHAPYGFYFREVTCHCFAGKVKVCGRVPTDRLKQLLWSLILDLDGVVEIDDQLDVVSSTGLSSIRPR